jgi:hypothetical protein
MKMSLGVAVGVSTLELSGVVGRSGDGERAESCAIFRIKRANRQLAFWKCK